MDLPKVQGFQQCVHFPCFLVCYSSHRHCYSVLVVVSGSQEAKPRFHQVAADLMVVILDC